jgi:hypothetical protein
MAAFYNKGDQEIYKNFQYVPQEKYRLGFTAPTTAPTAAPVSGGITNTNAFTNSGGNDFNPSGNAFGYGSPVSEVNVRTFNPQSLPGAMTPGGQNANTVYNQAFKDLNDPSLKGMSNDFVGKKAQDVMDYANKSIMDYRQNYGAQGQYISPYEDSMELPYQGTLGNNEMYPSEKYPNSFMKGKLNRFRNTAGDVMKFAGKLLPFPLNMATQFLPKGDDNGIGGGSYGIAGLSDAQKEAYNTLAKDNMLFGGQQGFKTSTGKNFTGKGYMQGQKDIFNEMTEQGYGMDEDGNVTLNGVPLTNKQNFKKLKYKESSAMYKATEKQKQKQENETAQAAATTAVGGTTTSSGLSAQEQQALNNRYNAQSQSKKNQIQQSTGGQFDGANSKQDYDSDPTSFSGSSKDGGLIGYGGKSGTPVYQQYFNGGRAGYFFGGRVNYKVGGRVNFKNGGLASIL